jgi:hypothetical protein
LTNFPLKLAPDDLLGLKLHIMKTTKQTVITWIRKAGSSVDELAVVHSHPLNSSEEDEAYQKLDDRKATKGFIPIVFLDPELNIPELQTWIQAEAVHRSKTP